MRVMLGHNFYASATPSGENSVFEAERTLLLEREHEVSVYERRSDDIRGKGALGLLKGALATPWNPWTARDLEKRLREFRPEVVHVHNTFPLISPSIFHAVGKRAARVLTLHNYRIFCPAAIPMRRGRVCTECLDRRSPLPALRYGCYRNSRLATLPLALGVALHRALGTWADQVDAFIALSEFQRDLLVAAGLPAHKIHLKPNFYPGSPEPLAWSARSPYLVFAGRLSAEKGVRTLLAAWKLWGEHAPELRIVGDGPLRPELERMAQGLPVSFTGQLAEKDAQAQIAQARLLILPSECFEGFPMVIREAFAFGTPCAVADLGPLPSIVRHGGSGLVFQPGAPEALLQVVRDAWQAPGVLADLGKGARLEYQDKYTEKVNYKALMEIYRQALEVSRHG